MEIKFTLIAGLLFGLFFGESRAQDPKRFIAEIEAFTDADLTEMPRPGGILFVGSSSFRMWKDVNDYFPDVKILNRGFGGSHFSDLIFYRNELINKYAPSVIFIYEGDNDLADGKSPKEVLKDAKKLFRSIRAELSGVRVVFLAAKPSPSRMEFRAKYEEFNTELKAWAGKKGNAQFADIWTPMFAEDGSLPEKYFLEDKLHMTAEGYKIWAEVLRKFL